MTGISDIQRQKSRSAMRGSGMLYGSKGFVEVLKHIHHVEEHQAGVLVLFLLGECLETILLIEGNGREVGIDSDVTKSRLVLPRIESLFKIIHQPCSDILSTKVQGNCETADLDAWVAAELLAHGETRLNLLPSATRYLITADAVVQQTEISSNTSIVFKDERIGDAQLLCLLGIIEQEFVQVAVSTVKASHIIIGSQEEQAS